MASRDPEDVGPGRVLALILGFVPAVVFSLGASSGEAAPSVTATTSWRTLQPGVEYASFPLPNPLGVGESRLHVVRIDPRRAHLDVALASEHGGARHTAGDWCAREHLSVAINVGMFREDGVTNVGYLRHGDRINNGKWTGDRAVLCLQPRRAQDPALRWIDRDASAAPGGSAAPAAASRYGLVIQDLRLIRSPGVNVWSPTSKRWSEAAVARDDQGRLLLLFARVPLSMAEFNRALLGLPLRVVQAMHVEGGPEASLSIHAGGVNLDFCGSYETGFNAGDSNHAQWPIPNVLGVRTP